MQVWKLSLENIEEMAERAAGAVQKGKILACPTDTVYGLIADAANKKAVKKVLLIKGRKETKPLPIFVKDVAMAQHLARFQTSQKNFLKKVWPGKVTVVLKSRAILPKETGTSQTIGLRIPKHKLTQLILQKAKTPLTGTSTNLSGEPPLYDSKEIFRQFQNRKYAPDILIDAGKLPFSRPSKVIDITGQKKKVLRK